MKIIYTRTSFIFYLIVGLSFLNFTNIQAQPCPDISTIPCDQIVQSLPLNLNFDGTQGGLFDGTGGSGGLAGNSLSTGFTMALPHSNERLSEDLPISYPDILGYEPSKIAISGGNLLLTSSKGIAYLNRDASHPSGRTNTQVNSLGVGLQIAANQIIEIQSQLLNITTGGGAAQAGIWYGIDDNNFVKFAVVDNDLEFRVESNGNSFSNQYFIINNLAGLPGGDVQLKLAINPAANTVSAFYTINGGTETQAGGDIALPQAIKDGVSLDEGAITGVSYAGIYNTHRNSNNAFVATFDNFSITQPTNDVGPEFPIQVNFQDANTTPPNGYFRDFGAAYGLRENGLNYGWLKLEDNTPLDLTQPSTGSGRNRNVNGVSVLQNTLIHMQGNDIGTWSGNRANEAYWEIELPNGNYLVSVGVGDPLMDAAAPETLIHHINVEGITAINLFEVGANVPTGNPTRHTQATVTVTVTDGKLTINADNPGAHNTKINSVEISQADSPSLFFAEANQAISLDINSSIEALNSTLSTTDNAATDVSLTAIDSENNVPQWLKVNGAVLDGNVIHNTAVSQIVLQYDVTGLSAGTYSATITAEASGYSPASFVVQLEVNDPFDIDFPVQVNFQDINTTPPTGYVRDYGLAYGSRENGLTYGWLKLEDDTPLDLTQPSTGSGRNRNVNGVSVLQNTLIHMQGNDIGTWSGNRANEAYWEIELPNGNYLVSVGVGDPLMDAAAPETIIHHINVEGITAINLFEVDANVPTGNPTRHTQATVTVTVTDGKLTINADNPGAHNTKINSVEISQADSPSLFFAEANQAISLDINSSIETLNSTLSTTDNAATDVSLTAIDSENNVPQWLKINGAVLDGNVIHNTAVSQIVLQYDVTGLSAGTYSATITAEASGYSPASFVVQLEVNDPSDIDFPVQVNFQDANTTPPTGYARDYGLAYGLRENGLTYGWLKLEDGTPLDLSQPGTGVGRNRNLNGVSLLQNTLVHMQGNDIGTWTGNRANEGSWEIELPNGNYLVHVSVGDPQQDGNIAETPIHHINVEGVTAINLYAVNSNTPNGDPNRFTDATVTVTVTDGRLTINADHPDARNTKINAVEISPADSPSLFFSSTNQSISIPENGSGSTLSNSLSTTDNTAPEVTLTANDGDANIPQWLKINGAVLDGNITHNTSEPEIVFEFDVTGLLAGTYSATITAEADGYTMASFIIQLEVTDPIEISFPVLVNFQDINTTTPDGYLRDYGQSYGPRDSGLNYGWVTADDNKAPLTLIGNGRNRNETGFTVLENTLMHMQYDDVNTGNGVKEEGYWEIELPNGNYEVSVTLGDASPETQAGTHHVINAEGIQILDFMATNGSANMQTNARIINLTDGKLTITAIGGINTKISSVAITPFESTQPFMVGINIADGATGVSVNTAISSSSIYFPNVGQTIDDSTLTDNSVFLRAVLSGEKVVASSLNSTGGGDAITFTPAEPLQPFTEYEFVVTEELKDLAGVSFLPFSSTFITGVSTGGSNNPAVFSKQVVAAGRAYASLSVGPDNKLYGLSSSGIIDRWDINEDGTLANKESITSLQTAEGDNRLAIGMAFDPTATSDNLVLWISHTTFGFNDMPDWGGKLTKLSGASLETVQDYVINLPRSIRDHVTNCISFKPGQNGEIYILQGSNSAMGLPDNAWGNRSERLLNSAILKVDIAQAEANGLPVDVKTEEGGNYDPYAASAPLTLYATGIRNAYSMVWHSNGQLYVPTNGSAGGGHAPSTIGSYDPITPNTQSDFLYRVEEGGFYGHPNPTRNEWIMNGGNPTAFPDGPDEVAEYAVGTQPEANYRGYSYHFGPNKSANGVIEYKSNVFNGALQGKILVVRYSQNDDIIVLTPGGADLDIVDEETQIEGFYGFNDPLNLVEHLPTGNIYLSEYGPDYITLLKPVGSTPPAQEVVATPEKVVVDDIVGGGAASPRAVTITNNMTSSVNITEVTLSGEDADQFSLDLTSLNSNLGAGQITQFSVIFNPTSLGPKFAEATINVAGEDPIVVSLNGLGKAGLSGTNEPSLQWILDTYFGTGTVNVGDDDATTTAIHSNDALAIQPTLGEATGIQKFVKAGDGPVTLKPLAMYGVTDVDPAVRFLWYVAGSPNNRGVLFSVPTTTAQTLNVETDGTLSFDPGEGNMFGFATEWPYFSDRRVYTEDALNTFNGAIPGHVKVYALPGEENAYIIATEAATTSGYDYNDIVMLVRNVRPPTVDTGAEIALENMTKLPGSDVGFPANDMYTFHRTQFYPNNHRTNTMRIHNSGVNPLVINDLVISNTSLFRIQNIDGVNYNSNQLPISIDPGTYKDVLIDFHEGSGEKGLREATITILSNADNRPQWEIPLKGTFQVNVEGDNEPNSQQIMQALGFTTSMNGQPHPNSDYPEEEDVNNGVHGDLILSEYFEQADPTQPVRAIKIASLRGVGSSNTRLLRTNNNNIVSNFSYNSDGDWYQTLLPKSNNSNEIAGRSVNSITTSFRISVEGYRTSGGNTFGQNSDNILGVRVYKVYDRNGKIIPYNYIVIQDYIGNGCGNGSGGNCDWNDNVEYFMNIKPVNDPFVANEIEDHSVTSGTVFTYPIAEYFDNGFAGNKLTYTATIAGSGAALPGWLILNPQTGTFSGIPPTNESSVILDIAVTATDENGMVVFGGSATTFKLTILGENDVPPVANAGADQTLTDSNNNGNENVTLDASNSSDPDGTIASYVWEENSTQIATGVNPTVTLPVGIHNITLTVTDDDNNTDTDEVVITINPQSTSSQQVVSFTLIDAVTDQPISGFDPIPEGAVINLAQLPNQELTIVANTNSNAVGSVVMQTSGAGAYTFIDDNSPFSLLGDGYVDCADLSGLAQLLCYFGIYNPIDYYGWTASPGNYTVTAIPYTQDNGSGEVGIAKTINFTIINNASARTLTASVSKEKVSEIAEIKPAENSMQVFPNPVDKTLNIRVSALLKGKTSIQLIDPTGRVIMDKNYTIAENEDIITLDLTGMQLSPGILFLKLSPENGPGTIFRIMKQ